MPTLRRLSISLLLLAGQGCDPPPLRAQTVNGDSVAIDHARLRTAALLTAGYVIGGSLVMEHVWYRDRDRVPFHFYDDLPGFLQVDKLGHAYGAYFQSHVGYHWLRQAGLSKTDALLFGGTLGLVLQTPIEVMDGLHEGWGFSWSDMAANALGAGLVIVQESLGEEPVVRYKFSYQPSRYAELANGYFGDDALERLLEDYNGHTYWLSVPLRRLTGTKRVPAWLSVAVGYGANGMLGEFGNPDTYRGVPLPPTPRYRQYLLSLDVDWSRVRTDSPVLRVLLGGLTFVKLPSPALEFTSRGALRAHWLYY